MLDVLADEALKALQLAGEETTKLVVPAAVGAAFAGAGNLRQLMFRRIVTLPRDPAARTAKVVDLLEKDPEFRAQLFAAMAELKARGTDLIVPPGPDGFRDRTAVLAQLGEPGIRVVVGRSGWGKTYLAQQVRHLRAAEYPDGNAVVDCAQFRTDGALRYAEVFASVLRQLGLSMGEAGDAELFTRYERALLHGRFLLVFDNVDGAAEARELARNWPLSLVLLTIRELTDDLHVWCPTPPVLLGGLDDGAGRELLAHQVGATVLDAEPEATGQLLELCDDIPDLLRRAGATLRLRRADVRPVARLVAELRAGQDPRGFDGILTALGLKSLPEAVRADLAVLSIHPGRSFTRDSADALLGHPAGATIDTLLSAGLAVDGPDGQIRLLRLVRQRVVPSAEVRDAALRRLLDDVARCAMAADHTLEGDRLRPGALTGDLAWRITHLSPVEYLDTHTILLVDLVEFAHHAGLHDIAIRLCGALEIVLTYRGRHHLIATGIGWGIRSAHLLGDDLAGARLYSTRGRIETALAEFDRAAASLDIAEEHARRVAFPRLDSSLLEFRARLERDRVQYAIDRGAEQTRDSFGAAADLVRQALEVDRAFDLRRARGIHARELANLEVRAGRAREARDLLDEAMLFTDPGKPRNVSRIHLVRARVHDLLEEWELFDSSIALARENGSTTYDLEIDDLVAGNARRRGDIEGARRGWDALAERFYALAHPRYARYKDELNKLPPVRP
ncbi:AAA family ATPase [Actinoplanes couchii]|uniref:FHA domain-containing protein n=1 Tax=Actinoplanes couchii TaxID=403638 RepID=A0ABQ3X3V5_9ACTN|nr:AAA family ATPase [Actinoplanes couchii]GID53191.1 hypothetical protein Aco03nite_015950 [Actinoplanes couchii]